MTNEHRRAVIAIAQAHPSWNHAQVAAEFARKNPNLKTIDRSTVCKLLKDKDKYLKPAEPLDPNAKRAKGSSYPQLDSLLWQYFKEASVYSTVPSVMCPAWHWHAAMLTRLLQPSCRHQLPGPPLLGTS